MCHEISNRLITCAWTEVLLNLGKTGAVTESTINIIPTVALCACSPSGKVEMSAIFFETELERARNCALQDGGEARRALSPPRRHYSAPRAPGWSARDIISEIITQKPVITSCCVGHTEQGGGGGRAMTGDCQHCHRITCFIPNKTPSIAVLSCLHVSFIYGQLHWLCINNTSFGTSSSVIC